MGPAVGCLWCWGSLEIGSLPLRKPAWRRSKNLCFWWVPEWWPMVQVSGNSTWVEIIAFAFPPVFAFPVSSFVSGWFLFALTGSQGHAPKQWEQMWALGMQWATVHVPGDLLAWALDVPRPPKPLRLERLEHPRFTWYAESCELWFLQTFYASPDPNPHFVTFLMVIFMT